MITLFARIVAQHGKEEEVYTALQAMLPPSRAEVGCHEYRLCQSKDDPTVFLAYEVFASKEALESHMQSSHFVNLLDKIGSLLVSEPKLEFVEEISE